MKTPLPPAQKRIELTLSVSNEAQARELEAAWREIITGEKLPRTQGLARDEEEILERARTALEIIETALREHPASGQADRLVQFLAAIYNGYDYAFDLTDLRALDTHLANACLDYLNYDRLGKREVHHHLAGGDVALQRWIEDHNVPPRLILDDEQQEAFMKLMDTMNRGPNELLREAIAALMEKKQRRDAPHSVLRSSP
jgi:hypothetical protein